jgi:hypothetical protein
MGPAILAVCLNILAGAAIVPAARAQAETGTLCTRAYLDSNANGFFEAGERLFDGASVSVAGGALARPALYTTRVVDMPECIDALDPGLYTVSVTAPEGAQLTSPGYILAGLGAGQKLTVEVGLSDNGSGRMASLCASLYEDVDRDGTREEGDDLVRAGRFTRVEAASGRVVGTHQAQGLEPYCFYDLQASSYWIFSDLPDGWVLATQQRWQMTPLLGSTGHLDFGAYREDPAVSRGSTGSRPSWFLGLVLILAIVLPLVLGSISAATLVLTTLIWHELRWRHLLALSLAHSLSQTD